MNAQTVEKIYSELSVTYCTFSENDNEWSANGLDATPFRSLVSVMLSTMTHTKRVIKAAVDLFSVADTPEEILKLDDDTLRSLIKPVAHYNRKTVHLKEMSRQLLEHHNGQVPHTREELLALKGVGRKCTDIMMNFTFDGNTIAVDTHVHRILNRTGMVHTKTHEESANAVMKITPDHYKKHAHEWLIQHGMTVCIAQKPHCLTCRIRRFCEYDNKIQ